MERHDRRHGVKDRLLLRARQLEDWIDRMALRLGDAVFGVRWSERLFGPHPSRR